MPFIKLERRELLKAAKDAIILGTVELEPGDRCYLFYKEMVRKWKENPRWTTIHNIYKDSRDWRNQPENFDDAMALELAWQVFFSVHVLDYERQKRLENGDVE